MRKVHYNRNAGTRQEVMALCSAKSIRLTSKVDLVTCSKCGKMIADIYTEDMKLDKGAGRD